MIVGILEVLKILREKRLQTLQYNVSLPRVVSPKALPTLKSDREREIKK